MIAFAAFWLIQDFAQVLMMGLSMVPDIFLLSIILSALLSNNRRDRQILLIWIAFLGGLIWDLRWTNLTGLTAAVNAAAVSLVCFVWQMTPAQGRTVALFTVMCMAVQIFSGVVHYIFWIIPSQAAVRQITVQSLLSVPVIIIISLLYWKASDKHV